MLACADIDFITVLYGALPASTRTVTQVMFLSVYLHVRACLQPYLEVCFIRHNHAAIAMSSTIIAATAVTITISCSPGHDEHAQVKSQKQCIPSAGERDAAADAQLVGTVMVRDIVNRQLVAHFRAHTSPLLALQFDPSGTILVTASLHGHNVHIFHICPWQGTGSGRGSGSARPLASAVHLYRLARGVTPAVIRDLSFSRDGAWLAVSSARGTTHIFRCVACMLLHKPRTFSCVTPLFVYPSLYLAQ